MKCANCDGEFELVTLKHPLTGEEPVCQECHDYGERELRLWNEHDRVVEFFGGEIYNHGWGSGDEADGSQFIHSKTSVGRLYSLMEADGSFKHWWTPGGGRGFSAYISESAPVSLTKRAKAELAKLPGGGSGEDLNREIEKLRKGEERP